MEFSEKLQQLRKQNNMTQEQLAEKLFVSRTAVSKWETGNGYPGIDTLKSISQVFGVSIDELLSGEQIVDIASNENKNNIRKLLSLVFAVIDILALIPFVFPIYGFKTNEKVIGVTLFQYYDGTTVRLVHIITLALLVALGVVEIIMCLSKKCKISKGLLIASLAVGVLAVLFFTQTLQPYVTCLMFVCLLAKFIILFKIK